MRLPVVAWLLFTVLPVSAFAQKGLLLHKDAPWEADQFVQTTPYKEIAKFPTVHNVVTMTGNKLRVNSALVVKDIVFPTPASFADIADGMQVAPLETAVADWTATMKRYPSSAKHLRPHLTQLQAEIAQFRTGKVKVAGEWMTKEALLAKQQKAEEERRKLAAKLDQEAKQLGIITAEWANLDEQGRKRAREEKRRAEEAQLQANEERRIQQEVEKQRKLAEERAKMKPVERLATDTWILPLGLKEQQTKEYEEALKIVNEQLGKARQELGFGKEAQRMILKTADRVYAFKAAEISPQVQSVQSEEKDKPPVLVLEATEGKEVIEALPMDGSDGAKVTVIPIPTTAASDVEKLTQGLSQILELCRGKRTEKVEKEQ